MSRAYAVPVLMYHHVCPELGKDGFITVTPETFRAQMRQIANAGWTTLTCAQFEKFLAGDPVPKRSVLITFDDGFLDNWVYAYPILKEFGLHAVFFIVTGWIHAGEPRPHLNDGTGRTLPNCPHHRAAMELVHAGRTDEVIIRWSEIRAMQASGTVEFHSHTHTHTRWDKRFAGDPAAKSEALREDLEKAKKSFTENLGAATQHLCWPQGYFDPEYENIAGELGFTFLHTTKKLLNRGNTPPTRISRINVRNRSDGWLKSRLRIYSSLTAGTLYTFFRGK